MKEKIYILVDFNESSLPRFRVIETFKTFNQGKAKYYKLKEEAKKNGWTRNYILTKSLYYLLDK